MSANLMTLSLRTAKRNRAQFVPFLPGVQAQNFAEVSKILEASKRYYGIVGDVLVILAEDETRIKPHVRWESRRDTLIGFCGLKEGHTCRLGMEVAVGSVGPVIGHASDGDSRRRKLMLSDYRSVSGSRWNLDWEVSGVTETLSEKNMVSIECWYDVQMSCHMVVLLCILFRDKFTGQRVPLHLLGSDCCEHFFSRVGGMSGYERNYDFADLIDCASGLNRLAYMEYGEENIHFGRSHAKQQTIWGKLHPLLPGVRNQVWWRTPWIIENELRLFDSSVETAPVLVDTEIEEVGGDNVDLNDPGNLWDLSFKMQGVGSDVEEDDGADDLAVVATLVSQLVGNPTLSKDRLTRIKQSIYFNGVKQKARVEGVPVCILDIGSDCAVLFDTETAGRCTRSQRRRIVVAVSKEVWIGRVQKVRRKYNGKWGKTRAEIDLLERPVGIAGEGCICQILFN
ncbi:hypothetical protein R1sor_007695 [Riccia sorocarpa]|uniref:Uncharacterized protein n=1 Tax=Riccia sorocarpa TaxID=122646 RepID=A0ABD3HTP2_9MARC